MEDFFLPLKAKAPIIFKVKTASALEFHIQFGQKSSRREFIKSPSSHTTVRTVRYTAVQST